LDNYDSQGGFGTPFQPPSNASIVYWVWIYNIKEHEHHRKRVCSVCDGSAHGGQAFVSGATYTPTKQRVESRNMLALSALLGLFLWHSDVANAFTESDEPLQH